MKKAGTEIPSGSKYAIDFSLNHSGGSHKQKYYLVFFVVGVLVSDPVPDAHCKW